MTRATRRTIPAPAYRLPIGNRGTRSRPQAIHRAKPTQLPSRAWPEFSGLNTVAKNGLANLGKQAMLTQPSARKGESQSMSAGSHYVVGACGLILAMVSIFVRLEISVATAWSGTAPAVEIVDRTGKGDRLPLAPAFHRNAVNQPLEIDVLPTLIYGCEPLASSLTKSPLAQIAGRCLS